MSVESSASASVSVTVAPPIDGVPARDTVASLPPRVRFTVNAPLARLAAAARSSSNVMTSVVPFTVAESTAGAVVSNVGAPLTARKTLSTVSNHPLTYC